MATKHAILYCLSLTLLALSGCASVEPFPVTPHSPALNAVRHDVAGHTHQATTWGGTILTVEVKQKDTLVSVLARPIDQYGEPQISNQSDGRFIARFKGFADPVLFSTGRRLTVSGSIAGSETRKIGDYFYVYPIVDVSHYRLWPVEAVRVRRADDWWYDPWFYGYPWYYPAYPVYVPVPAPPPATRPTLPPKTRR